MVILVQVNVARDDDITSQAVVNGSYRTNFSNCLRQHYLCCPGPPSLVEVEDG